MLRKPLALLLICLFLLFAVSVNGDSAGISQAVVNIPGQLKDANNVVFSRDGRSGFVASFRRSDGTAGNEVYSFNTATGEIIDLQHVAFSPTAIAINKYSGTMVVSGSSIDLSSPS